MSNARGANGKREYVRLRRRCAARRPESSFWLASTALLQVDRDNRSRLLSSRDPSVKSAPAPASGLKHEGILADATPQFLLA